LGTAPTLSASNCHFPTVIGPRDYSSLTTSITAKFNACETARNPIAFFLLFCFFFFFFFSSSFSFSFLLFFFFLIFFSYSFFFSFFFFLSLFLFFFFFFFFGEKTLPEAPRNPQRNRAEIHNKTSACLNPMVYCFGPQHDGRGAN